VAPSKESEPTLEEEMNTHFWCQSTRMEMKYVSLDLVEKDFDIGEGKLCRNIDLEVMGFSK